MKQRHNRSGGCRARSALLGVELRAAREEKQYGVRELARRIGVNPAQLNSWESALRSPDMMDIAGILGALGVVGERKERILAVARLAESEAIVLGQADKPHHIEAAEACARMARSIVDWHPFLIPDIVRTRAYAEAALHLSAFPREAVTEDLLNTRALAAIGHLHVNADVAIFIGERAITHTIGNPLLALQQLRSLLLMTEPQRAPNVTINIVPSHNGGTEQAFTRYYTHAGPITYVSQGFCGSFTLDHQELHGAVIDQLAATACNPRESAILIEEHIQRLDHELTDGD
ncbi:Scr1 family TA system antitoxin-like transcriptional regulator [Amycolatopsis sp. VC5-11]|uniref:Scr1 family TA system antitoxin-like transcriptional regulator n=1 Tax=Amycolatopsis sp. VC5-11 TaxID=3120156 RepID=UPI003009F151